VQGQAKPRYQYQSFLDQGVMPNTQEKLNLTVLRMSMNESMQ